MPKVKMCQHGDCQKHAKALAFLSMVCSMFLKHLSKLDSWRTKKVAKYLQQMSSLCKSCHEEIEEQLRADTGCKRCFCGASVVPSLFSGSVAVKKPFLWKGNWEKWVRFSKLFKNWTENQQGIWIWYFWFILSSVSTEDARRGVQNQVSVKHTGGSVVVWCCILARGVGDRVKNDRIMNTQKLDFDPPCNTVWKESESE